MQQARSRHGPSTRRDHLLAILVVIAVMIALKLTKSVTLPLAFGLFLAALTWPVYRLVSRWLPRGVAALAALLSFLVVIGGMGWALFESAEQVASKAPQYSERLSAIGDSARSFAEKHGLPAPDAKAALESARSSAMGLSRSAVGFFGGSVLVCAFLLLGLLEISDYSEKLTRGGRDVRRWKRVADQVAKDFQRYVAVRTLIGLITGVAVTLACFLIGLDLGLLWGLVNFLFNYIPTLGSIAGVVPPVLFALATEGPTTALLALAVIGGIQLVMGNWIDPLIQGHYLKLSPLVVLLSVVFWGWVWGIAGAFIAMPLTIVIVLVCREFESTRWIAIMLAAAEETEQIEREPLRGEPDGQKVSS